jgi:Cyclic nucleotide-binding domain
MDGLISALALRSQLSALVWRDCFFDYFRRVGGSRFWKTTQGWRRFGEIGVFAHNQVRTATVVCRTDCTLFELTEQKVRELYFEDGTFGYAVLQLIIQRLIEHNERLLKNRPA